MSGSACQPNGHQPRPAQLVRGIIASRDDRARTAHQVAATTDREDLPDRVRRPLRPPAVLRPGDLVRYDGADHQVIALAGTSVWLRSEHGAESVVAYQMASPEFAVIDGARVVHERDGSWFVSTN